MLQLFRTNSPLAAILVAIYVLLLNIQGFIVPQDWEPTSIGLFSEWVYSLIEINSIWAKGLSLILILSQGLLVNALVNQFKVTRTSTFFPAVFYVFSISLLKDAVVLSPLLMGMTFYIIALFQMFRIYKTRGGLGTVFNIGFWVAVGSLFYFSLGMYLLLGIVGLSLLISLRYREILVLLVGFFTPYYLLVTYFFWIDGLSYFWQFHFVQNYGFVDFEVFESWKIWPKLIFVGFVLVFSLLNIQNLLSKTKIQIQKYIWLLFWSLPIGALTVFVQAGIQTEHLIIICVPISVFLCLHFLAIKNKPISEFLHLFLLLLYFGFKYWDVFLGLVGR